MHFGCHKCLIGHGYLGSNVRIEPLKPSSLKESRYDLFGRQNDACSSSNTHGRLEIFEVLLLFVFYVI